MIGPVAQTVVPEDLKVIVDNFDADSVTGTDLIIAGAVLIGGFVLSRFVRRFVRRLVSAKSGHAYALADLAGRIAGYMVILLAIVLALEVVGFNGSTWTILLIVALIAFLAARPMLENLGAGIILQARSPFDEGDWIVSGDVEGQVQEVNARAVVVETIDGRRITVPNETVLALPIENLTAHDRRMTVLELDVVYGTDVDLARITAIAALAEVETVWADPEPKTFAREFGESAISIDALFWHDPEPLPARAARDDALRAIDRAFRTAGVEFAFPQRTLWWGDKTETTSPPSQLPVSS